MNKIYSVRHSLNSGDLIYSLAGFNGLYQRGGSRINLYQTIGRVAYYYDGADHPVRNDHGDMVNFNKQTFDWMLPLLEAQPYVASFAEYRDGRVDYDLDKIRGDFHTGMTTGVIYQYQFYVYPELWCDTSQPWLFVSYSYAIDELVRGKVLVNFTSRYRNHKINYRWLNRYKDHLLFVGTEKECRQFQRETGISEIGSFVPDNYLELAQAINQCEFLMGNQSLCMAIAEALKARRMMEASLDFPNCHPSGADGYAYKFQFGAEEIFKLLAKEKKETKLQCF